MKYTIKEIQAFASASSIAQEVLQNIRTVTAFQGQRKEEERWRIYHSKKLSWSFQFRFANSLIDAKKMGLKKGFFMGLCQGLSQIFTFLAFTITFWYSFDKYVSKKKLCVEFEGTVQNLFELIVNIIQLVLSLL